MVNITQTKEYRRYMSMLTRCYNPKSPSYKYYGARRISVCERWRQRKLIGFKNYLSDMGAKPSPEHSVDRIDNNGNYEPNNCRWATRIEQQNNTRKNRLLEFRGQIKTLSEWALSLGLDKRTLHNRLKKHSVEVSISKIKYKKVKL